MPREHHSWTAQELASWANKGLIWRKGLSRWPYYTSWCCPTGAIHICGSLLQLTGSVVLQKWTFLYLKFHSPNLYCSHVKAHSTYQWCTLEGRIPFTVLSHVPVIPVKWDRSTDFIWSEFCTSYLTFVLFQNKKSHWELVRPVSPTSISSHYLSSWQLQGFFTKFFPAVVLQRTDMSNSCWISGWKVAIINSK